MTPADKDALAAKLAAAILPPTGDRRLDEKRRRVHGGITWHQISVGELKDLIRKELEEDDEQ